MNYSQVAGRLRDEGGRGELSQLVGSDDYDKMVVASMVIRTGTSSVEMAAVLWR